MHPRVFAERRAIALQRQQNAAAEIAKLLGIDAPAPVNERDPDIRTLKDAESMADFLESVAAQPFAPPKSKKAKE